MAMVVMDFVALLLAGQNDSHAPGSLAQRDGFVFLVVCKELLGLAHGVGRCVLQHGHVVVRHVGLRHSRRRSGGVARGAVAVGGTELETSDAVIESPLTLTLPPPMTEPETVPEAVIPTLPPL